MRTMARLASLWRTITRSDALDRDLDEEIDAAVALLADRHVAAGLTPDAARRAAIATLGGPAGIRDVKATVREDRVGRALDALLGDLRYAWRSLRHTPRLTLVAVTTLALGMGATAAIFSIVRTMLIAPLPYRAADRLVFIWLDRAEAGYPRGPMSGPDLRDLRLATRSFADLAAIWATGTIALTGDRQPEQLRAAFVTTNFFEVLGAERALGRSFRAEDAWPGAHPTILLGWELFERRFGADPAIVGRDIIVDGRSTTVVGVMPPGFRLLLPPDASVPDRLQAWRPFWPDMETSPRGHLFLRVVGRLRQGVDVAAARADVDAAAAGISRTSGVRRVFTTAGLHAEASRDLRRPLLVLFAGVGVLLAIACVNVAGLLVARAAAKRRETGLRRALGAPIGRLLRQAAMEGLLLTGLGAGVGLAVGWAALQALLALAPEPVARIRASQLDGGVVAVSLLIAVIWGVLLTAAPASELFRDTGSLSDAQGRRHAGAIRYRTRATLVLVQVGFSVVLLVVAGLLVRTFLAVQRVDPGFEADRHLTVKVAWPEGRYSDTAAVLAADRALRSRLAALPGVTGVAAMSHLPYDHLPNWALAFAPDGTSAPDGHPSADARAITPGLLEVLGTHLVDGRPFIEDERPGTDGVPAVIVDDLLARRLWPGQSAIGRTFLLGQGAPDRRARVVGVIRHLRQRSLVEDLTPQVFLPYQLWQRAPMAYVVRADRDPANLATDVRAAILAMDPHVPPYDLRPLAALVDDARATQRFTMQLATAFAATALALTCLGVYGVLAYAVAVRQCEIGVRRALGATTARIVGLVVREGASLAIAGATAGLVASALAASFLNGLLYGVAPRDPATYAAAIGLVVLGALAACAVPAVRAAAVSPMDALRAE